MMPISGGRRGGEDRLWRMFVSLLPEFQEDPSSPTPDIPRNCFGENDNGKSTVHP